MANPFGDDLAPESAEKNPFGDELAGDRSSYIWSSLKAGAQDMAGAAATVQDTLNPFTTSEADMAQLYRNDPQKLAEYQQSSAANLQRFAKARSARSAEIMKELTPEGAELAKLEYATTDPSKAAWASPQRVIGDIARSIPQVATAVATYGIGRGAGAAARAAAVSQGASAAVAQAAAVRAAGSTMAAVGGASEGALGGAMAFNSTLQDASELSAEKIEASPVYQRLRKEGYSPEAARTVVEQQAAQSSGLGAGIANAVVGAGAGKALGGIMEGGGSILKRAGKSALVESTTEMGQSGLEKISENAANINSINPFGDPLAGVGEAVVAGGVVGGVSGGIMGGAFGPKQKAKVTQEHKKTLDGVATELEVQEATGLTPIEAKAVGEINTAKVPKPRLNGLQVKVASAAQATGVDPATALTIMQLESAGRVDAKNPNSTAQGPFQLLDSTWDSVGGGDRNDEATQINNGLKFIAENTERLKRQVGRDLTGGETYAGHMLGAGGGGALINAAKNNPDGSFLDTVRKYDAKNADAIVNNNRFGGMTNAEALADIESRFQKAQQRLGFDPVMNQALRVTPDSDRMVNDNAAEDDSIIDEIDAALADDELMAMTPEEELAYAAEQSQVAELEPDPATNEQIEAIDLDNAVDATPFVPIARPMLPTELQGATPRYGFGKRNYELTFDEDIDKAAYIIGNTKTDSAANAQYLKFVMDNALMTEDEARAYGKKIIAKVKGMAIAAKDSDATQITIASTPDINYPDSYVSKDEYETRRKYPNPNDQKLVSDTEASWASNEGVVGQTLRSAPIMPGEVRVLSEGSKHYPEEYTKAAGEFVAEMVRRFMPDASVLITARTMGSKFLAGYAQMTRTGQNSKYLRSGQQGVHQINIRNATGLNNGQGGSSNYTTQLKIAYSLAHEVGHAIMEHTFRQGMSLAVERKMDALGVEEFFTEEDLQQMPSQTAAVLREYNALKLKVLSDPKYTARQFIMDWLSPWKSGHGLQGKNIPGPESFAQKYLGEMQSQNLDDPARGFALTMQNDANILSPHEYMAEQFARYAYSKKLVENSSFGSKEFFANALAKMREFFASIKKQGIVKPGVEFSKWVDGLSRAAKITGNDTIPPAPVETPVVRATPATKKPRVRLKPQATAKAEALPEVSVVEDSLPVQTVNVAGADFNVAIDAEGDYYQVGAGNVMIGAPLGRSLASAKQALAAAARLEQARERSAKDARGTQKVLAPSILPVPTERRETIALGEKSEEQQMAESFLRTDPTLKELRLQDPDAFKELSDLVKKGKIEEFKEEAAFYLPDNVVSEMRWDTDNDEHMEMKSIADRLHEKLPSKAGVKAFLGHGLRVISDHKWYTMTLTQMAYRYPEIAGLQSLNSLMNQMKTLESRLKFRAVEATQAWSKMGKEQRGLMEKAMRFEHTTGKNLFELRIVNNAWRFTPNADTDAYAKANKLDADTVKLWLDVKNSYLQHMNNLQSVMQRKLTERMVGKPVTLKKKTIELSAMFREIRSRPFLPQTRFGSYAVKVVENGKIVHLEFFESASERDKGKELLKAAVTKGQMVEPSEYSNTTQLLRTLPLELLATYSEEFDLTAEQRKEAREMADVVTLNRQTRKYSNQLAQITGANKDLLRGYADFMSHDSNNIAKLFYREKFFKALRQIKELQIIAGSEQDFAAHDELKKMYAFADSYIDHMLYPAQEYHMLRSFVVIKMLWGNLKTAFANVVSLVHAASLAETQMGKGRGLGKVSVMAGKALYESTMNTARKVARMPAEGGSVFTEDERWAMAQAKANGLLDETFAAQLASFANDSALGRMNLGGVKSKWDTAIWAGMQPQHLVESYTRRVTILTQFNGYLKAGFDRNKAYELAQEDLYQIQGNNTQANKPAFMRGKKSTVLIFYGYMQQALYLMTGTQEKARNLRTAIASGATGNLSLTDARKKFYKTSIHGETFKMWLAYGMLGGLMGLPGAEDLDKILGLFARKMFGSDFNLKEYAFDIASDITNRASEYGVNINPRSIVHGAASNVSLFGLLPAVDLSGSVGLGNAIPGMGGMDKLGQRGGGFDVLTGLMGPAGSVVKDIDKAFSDDPSVLNRMGIVLPSIVKGAAKAIVEHENGVLYPSGGRVTFDQKTGQLRDLTTGETLVRLMGFMPEIISSNKELHWMQKDKSDFWTLQRNQLTTQMWEAHLQKDREAIADVRAKINEFNDRAEPKLRLSMSDVQKSIAKRRANVKIDEARTASAKRYRGLYKDMEAEFRGEED